MAGQEGKLYRRVTFELNLKACGGREKAFHTEGTEYAKAKNQGPCVWGVVGSLVWLNCRV